MSYGLATTKTEKPCQVYEPIFNEYEILQLESVDDFLTIPNGSKSKIERLIEATPDEAQSLCSDGDDFICDLYNAYKIICK